MTNHERFAEVFRERQGQLLSTAEIRRLMLEKYPDLVDGSNRPNEHGDGNKTPCSCSGSERQIFDRVEHGKYRVRVFVSSVGEVEEKGKAEPTGLVLNPKPMKEVAGSKALYLNGIFEDTLTPIMKNQQTNPNQPHYLQPYSASRILLLANSSPTPKNPVTLYLSVSTSLGVVSYRAKIVDWQDKRELDEADIRLLNLEIKNSQSFEEEIYRKGNDGKECANLISVVDIERIEYPFSVSRLIKTSDGEPLKNREVAGGWAVVREAPEWLGTMPLAEELEKEFKAEVAKSMEDDDGAMQQRLATASKLPGIIQVVSRAFRRNADVVAFVLKRAHGVCEECHLSAPFHRASDDSPYLEVHHRIMLSEGGEDTVANAFALCPNCHRKLHFGKNDSPNAV